MNVYGLFYEQVFLRYVSKKTLKKEKENILTAIGPKANSILPHYECAHCQDTGYVKQDNQTQMCNCLKQKIYDIEYNKSNMNSLEKQNFENFNIQLYSTDINPEKYQSDISPRENIELIVLEVLACLYSGQM